MPFAELHADFLHNGFGVYVLEFRSHSLLSDDNVDRLLLLNNLPQKYDLDKTISSALKDQVRVNEVGIKFNHPGLASSV